MVLVPYQQRVIVEKEELDRKIESLHEFLSSSALNEVVPDEAEQLRMSMQYSIMRAYSKVLELRIAVFKKDM